MRLLKEEVETIIANKCDLILECSNWTLSEVKQFVAQANRAGVSITLRGLCKRPQDVVAVASDPHGKLTIEV